MTNISEDEAIDLIWDCIAEEIENEWKHNQENEK